MRITGSPSPAQATVRRAVAVALASLAESAVIVVAVSGGPDSMALAAAAAHLRRRRSGAVGAVVVDHGLQAGSAQVAASAAQACERLGLAPVAVRQVQVSDDGSGPEAAARTARYAALTDYARELDASAILLGHTMDDQAESVLLGLARGSGARSLAGMAPARGLLLRPLLEVPRDVVHQAAADSLADLGIAPWLDPHNTDPRYARSRVRHTLLPVLEAELGPGVAAALARTARLLRDDADLLDELAVGLLDELIDPGPLPDGDAGEAGGAVGDQDVWLDLAGLAASPAALRRRVLLAAATRVGVPRGRLTWAHVAAMEALVTSWRGQGPVHLPVGVTATRRCGRLWLHRPAGQVSAVADAGAEPVE